MWILAALLAYTFPTVEATPAVIVVPIFSPKTIAAPTSKGIIPLTIRVIVKATVAEEDCIIMVNKAPKTTKSTVLRYGIPSKVTKKRTNHDSGPKTRTESYKKTKRKKTKKRTITYPGHKKGTASFKKPSTIKSSAKSIIALAQPFVFEEFIKSKGNPMASRISV